MMNAQESNDARAKFLNELRELCEKHDVIVDVYDDYDKEGGRSGRFSSFWSEAFVIEIDDELSENLSPMTK